MKYLEVPPLQVQELGAPDVVPCEGVLILTQTEVLQPGSNLLCAPEVSCRRRRSTSAVSAPHPAAGTPATGSRDAPAASAPAAGTLAARTPEACTPVASASAACTPAAHTQDPSSRCPPPSHRRCPKWCRNQQGSPLSKGKTATGLVCSCQVGHKPSRHFPVSQEGPAPNQEKCGSDCS